ncbi:hypothetical protein DKX38_005273 [Salix brachista]|uniref:Uncharacterized protein n=1 Tax=Salix brachista TaxID=2182728 RepID=A0A5N5ND55_9ROSI|nr:hypothetical protein DKX38_005273 [Salix brachista]
MPLSLFGKAAAYVFESDTFSSSEETLVDQNGSFHGSFTSRIDVQKFFTPMFHRSGEILRQDHSLNILCLLVEHHLCSVN